MDEKEQEAFVVNSFQAILTYCLDTPEMVKEWNRLTGNNLSVKLDKRSPIERMVDEATGYQKHLDAEQVKYLREFAQFVWETIYIPFVAQLATEKEKGHG